DTKDRGLRLLIEALGRERFDWERAAALPEGRRIVVISPAYNEQESVGDVVRAIPRELEGLQVIPVVVSDGSDDATARRARDAGALVTELPIRRGGGLALRVGYEIALQLGAEIVVTMDADGQHLPSELPVMIRPIIDGSADYVNASPPLPAPPRHRPPPHPPPPPFARIVTVLTGRRITDPSSGYRAARAERLEQDRGDRLAGHPRLLHPGFGARGGDPQHIRIQRVLGCDRVAQHDRGLGAQRAVCSGDRRGSFRRLDPMLQLDRRLPREEE